MKKLPQVLIVEDEPAIAELIAINLRHHGFTPVCAEDGPKAQTALDACVPDLIVLDWMLPGGKSGLELARHWRSQPRTKQVPILMLTARSDEPDKIAGLDAGADDYITKPFSVQELLARIRAVLRRRDPLSLGQVLQVGQLRMDGATHQVSYQGEVLKLGPMEFKLLSHFMRHPERVHSHSQLLDQVWGDDVYVEERTVDVHIKRLRQALGSGGGGGGGGAMLQTVRGAGYRLSADL